jgi:hypothetical protein
MSAKFKTCQKCQNAAALEAAACVRCGQPFPTEFAWPGLPKAPAPRQSAGGGMLRGCGVGCLVVIGLFFGLAASG